MTIHKGDFYCHFKGGMYQIVCVAIDEPTHTPVVVYQAMYGEQKVWVRTLAAFTETVEREGKAVPRFELQTAESRLRVLEELTAEAQRLGMY